MVEQVLPKGAVQQALESQLFGRFTVEDDVVAIGVNAAVLLKNNPERIGWLFINTGNIQITLRTIRKVIAGKGIIAAQQGDTINTTFIEYGMFQILEISAIAESHGGEANVIKFIRASK